MKTAVIYARYSSSGQREASIDDQVRVCTEWCRDNGYLIVGTYCDYAISGRTDDRPKFQEMILSAGESDIVLVYMMDRFSRDVYDAPIYKKKLRDKGVKVVSATEAIPDGPEAILIESVYEAMAAMESAHIARRVKRGLDGNARKCMHNGVKVFGYDWTEDGHFKVNEAEAEMVREVFDRRIAGESLNSIARDMADRGVRSKLGRPCRQQMISKMLENEKYIGIYQWGDIRIEGGIPAILDEDTFMRARETKGRKQRKAEHWHDYALQGKVVCSCGSNCVGTTGTGKHKVRYHYYQCSKRCGVRSMRSEALEGLIANQLREMLSSRETAMEIATLVSENVSDETAENRLKMAEKSLSEAKRGIDNIMRAVESGMPYADVRGRLEELKSQRLRAEADVAAWSERTEIDVEDFADFLQEGVDLTDRDLLDAFVWQVRLGDEITVTLNYGEPARLELSRGFAGEYYGALKYSVCEPHCDVMVAYRDGLVTLRMKRR